jgi:hypothetical protein
MAGIISAGLTSFFTWQNPATVPLLLVLSAFFVLVAGLRKWVRAKYVGPSGESRQVYFTDGSGFGLGAIFSGTKRLYDNMRATVLVDR